MRKWLSASAIGLILLLTAAPLALAAGHAKAHPAPKAKVAHAQKKTKPAPSQKPKLATAQKALGKTKFQCEAQVVSADAAGNALVVNVTSGSATIRAFRNGQLSLSVAATARFVAGAGDGQSSFTLSDLQPGARVHVGGTIDMSDPAAPVFVATKIILQQPQTPPSPTPAASDTASPEPSPADSPSAAPSPGSDETAGSEVDGAGVSTVVSERIGYAGVLTMLEARAHAVPALRAQAAALLAGLLFTTK